MTIERTGQLVDIRVPIEAPWTNELLDSLIIQALANLFWASGWRALVSASVADRRIIGQKLGAFLIGAGVMLSIGSISMQLPAWLWLVYNSGLWLLAPMGTILHLSFPKVHRFPKSESVALALSGLGLVGAMGSVIVLLVDMEQASRPLLALSYGWFALHLVVSIGLLVYGWSSSPTLRERRQLGVVAVGGLLAMTPLLVANLVPILWHGSPATNSNAMMLPLALLPASYVYALYRHDRLVQDKHLARILVYAFTAVVIAMLVALVFVIPGVWELQREYLVGVAILIGALAAGPTSRVVEQWLGWLLFGRLRQPLVAAAQATDAIDLSIDGADLSTQVAEILKAQLDIEHCAILVLDSEHRLIDPAEMGRARAAEGLEIKPRSALAELLAGDTAVLELDEARQRLRDTPGRVFFDVPWANLMLPLRNQGRLVGVLLTSYRSGASFLDEEDIIVLKLTAQALATALQRRALVVELREKNAEASQLSHELMRVRGEERKRIARDLHDDIVQPLIATSYTVAVMPDPAAEQVRSTLTELIERTRNICFELREPALDNLSFGAAARAVLSAFTQRTGREVKARIADGSAIQVGEAISAAALGVLDEALTNGEKHGGGEALQVDVRVSDDVLVVVIRDTGPGFDVAEARQRAAQTRHFGLAIMEERAASVGGQLSVASSPGRGTTITGYFPLPA
ncbi:MAG TPA: ATP-binding protein [Anaerolineales bacterium]|nr:ATP-binding protein [Anaerolineales bacterium]